MHEYWNDNRADAHVSLRTSTMSVLDIELLSPSVETPGLVKITDRKGEVKRWHGTGLILTSGHLRLITCAHNLQWEACWWT